MIVPISEQYAQQVQMFAGAAYGMQIGSNTMDMVMDDINAVGLEEALNAYFEYSFGASDMTSTVLTNLGIVEGENGLDATLVQLAEDYVSAELAAADPSERGEVVLEIAQLWTTLTVPEYADAVAAWNADLAVAFAYNGSNNATFGEVGAATTEFLLTSGTDDIDGTAGDDFFDAPLAQNATAGGVSNTLSTADALDGDAGADTLNATLVAEFFGSAGLQQIDIQPEISSIETIQFEAKEILSDALGFIGAPFGAVITVDAKDITDVDHIGSWYSDGNLVIENLTTLTSAGVARNTNELTVTMDHTDNFNSDSNASDLSVYFDEDYLLSGQESQSTLELRIVNAFQLAENADPLVGFLTVEFLVGATTVSVDISAETTYAGVVAAINAELTTQGIDTVTASALTDRTAVFTDDIQSYSQGDVAGQYTPVLLTSTDEVLAAGPIELDSNVQDFDGLNTWTNASQSTTLNPVAINVELEKVGRDNEGGDLFIGGKGVTASDGGEGISDFYVEVLGNNDQPSNLGQINTNNSDMNNVYITTALEDQVDYDGDGNVDDDDVASLTVRGNSTAGNPFGEASLNLINANGFLGDLTLGVSAGSDVQDVTTFTATGGGDITYWAQYFNGGGFPSLSANAFSATTGTGNDTFVLDIDSGAQVTVVTGGGNDSVTASIDTYDDSGSTPSFADISSSGGNNTITVTSSNIRDGIHRADIDTGGGADVVNGNSVSITVDTNAGDDCIYADNTGAMGDAGNLAGDWLAGVSLNNTTVFAPVTGLTALGASLVPADELLYGRQVRVTLAVPGNVAAPFVDGYETTVDIDIAGGGYISSELDLYNSVADAINNDPVLSKIATAWVDSNGNLMGQFLIDGLTGPVGNIQYEILGNTLSAADLASLTGALQTAYMDSSIGSAAVNNAYNDLTDHTQVETTFTVNGTDSVTTGGFNNINGGLGDDVLVGSSNVTAGASTQDTFVFDQGGFGDDVIIHFDLLDDNVVAAPAALDILDFSAWLDGVASASGSVVSQQRVAGTVQAIGTMVGNSVAITTFATIVDNNAAAATPLNFDTMTDSQVLAEINAAQYGSSAANVVGDIAKSIIMIEDVGNAAATDDNQGFFKVYEATWSDTASAFTSVQLVGTVDFGSTAEVAALADANVA